MTRLLFFCVAILLTAPGCSVKVRSLHLPGNDFTQYKSFCWLEGCEFTFRGPSYLNDSTIKMYMQKAIKSEMKRKGVSFDSTDPNLLADVQVVMKTDTTYLYHRPDEVYQFIPFADREEMVLLEGTFIIDLIDKKMGKMVWRSVAVSYFDQYPALTEANINRAVKSALKTYPPKK